MSANFLKVAGQKMSELDGAKNITLQAEGDVDETRLVFDEKFQADVEYLRQTFGSHPLYTKIRYKKMPPSKTATTKSKSKHTVKYEEYPPMGYQEDYEIGFVDTLGRFYMYERGGTEFRDMFGNYYKTGTNGFYCKDDNIYKFDDSSLLNNRHCIVLGEEIYCTLRALMDFSLVLPQMAVVKIPPNKRLFILYQSQFLQKDYSGVKIQQMTNKETTKKNDTKPVKETMKMEEKMGIRNKDIYEDAADAFLRNVIENRYPPNFSPSDKVKFLVSTFENEYNDIVINQDIVRLLSIVCDKCNEVIKSKSSIYTDLSRKVELTKIKLECKKAIQETKITKINPAEAIVYVESKIDNNTARSPVSRQPSFAELSDVAQASVKVKPFKTSKRRSKCETGKFDNQSYGPINNPDLAHLQQSPDQNADVQRIPYNVALVNEIVVHEVLTEILETFKKLEPLKGPSLRPKESFKSGTKTEEKLKCGVM